MGYPNTTTPTGEQQKARITFKQIGFNHERGTGKTIALARGGDNVNPNTAYDFNMMEDSSQTVDAVYTEGQSIQVETSLTYDPDNVLTSSLIPGWKPEEEAAFINIIRGSDQVNSTEIHAKYPDTLGKTDFDTSWLTADGKLGRAAAMTMSREAIALARELFPTVFRAWRVRTSAVSAALDGHGDPFTDQTEFPRLNSRRAIQPQQLQYMLRNLAESGSDPDNFISTRFPVRVQIYDNGHSPSRPIDVPFDVGIRVTNDSQGSLLWMDALAEQSDGGFNCVYTGSLGLTDASKIDNVFAEKKITVNLAMNMDHRVNSYQDYEDSDSDNTSELNYSTVAQIGGHYVMYVDSPTSYFEMHQVDSYPTASPKYYNGSSTYTGEPNDAPDKTTTAGALNRLLPPGSEQYSCELASLRKLNRYSNIFRTSSWSMIGIRSDFAAGDYVDKVHLYNDDTDDYKLRGDIKNVTYDFQNQVTHIGGVISEYF